MPPDIHTIRLRHPWQCEPYADGTRWIRSFNWPAGLTPREIARLVIEQLPDLATVHLNGQPLAATTEGQFNVTALLAQHNRLTLDLVDPPEATSTDCPLDVRLEIVEG